MSPVKHEIDLMEKGEVAVAAIKEQGWDERDPNTKLKTNS